MDYKISDTMLTYICRKFYSYELWLSTQQSRNCDNLLSLCKDIRYNIFYKMQCYTGSYEDLNITLDKKYRTPISHTDFYLIEFYFYKDLERLNTLQYFNLPTIIRNRIKRVCSYK